MVSIEGPRALLLPLVGDQANPLYALVAYCSFVGLKFVVDPNTGRARVDGITDLSMLTVLTVLGCVQAGAEVHGYPAWIEIPEAQLSQAVPAFVPGAEGKTWATWGNGSHSPTVKGGRAYIAGGSMGDELLGSTLAQLYGAGYVLRTLPEMRVIVNGP